MRICIPTETNAGKDAKVYSHFGSAPYFTVYDTEKDDSQSIENSNQHHVHGACHPISVLTDKQIDVVVCAGMGMRAIQKLNGAGIKAYKASGATVLEIIGKYKANELKEITLEDACSHNGCH
ncbi:MAG: NifB/NifX family molybdenum-iron cluster-binding protein [Phycisphaerae bacterium]|nr:NifB/NifX family molybdenum-iron cluster-binding protein [Phycisphaerae bacterium]MDD5380678.1 NifB/NifX family molybdenum-iron cluster-binding protein [Phycisphaerae bacterium]